jgi:hypothetical protein
VQISAIADALAEQSNGISPVDVVALWRTESSQAALRFLDHLRFSVVQSAL